MKFVAESGAALPIPHPCDDTRARIRLSDKAECEFASIFTERRPLVGLFAQLSEGQRQMALNYRGEEFHGVFVCEGCDAEVPAESLVPAGECSVCPVCASRSVRLECEFLRRMLIEVIIPFEAIMIAGADNFSFGNDLKAAIVASVERVRRYFGDDEFDELQNFISENWDSNEQYGRKSK